MERFGISGDAVVAFRGRCNVTGDDLVDMEDRRLGNVVAADSMLHFIVEVFGVGLPGMVFCQRLLCAVVKDLLKGKGVDIERRGDDLFSGKGKLSVSVATVSPVSGLVHLGLNIVKDGVPVEAACLEDLGVEPVALASEVLSCFVGEIEGSLDAARKVRPVM
jgi:hypothetical protein